MAEWQPIETAPEGDEKEGPFFDVIWTDHRHRYLPLPRREIDCFKANGVVQRKHGYPAITIVFGVQPTHWRELPKPPVSNA